MKGFLGLDRNKLLTSLGLSAALVGTILLKAIPPSIDVLDLNRIPVAVYTALGRRPLQLFDYLTLSRFKPKTSSFLSLPSVQQVPFLVFFDFVLVYLLSCLACSIFGRIRSRNEG